MLLFRRLSFWLALLGVLSATQLILRLRAETPPPPPPVAPPAKPFVRGIGASGLVEASRENTLLGVPLPGLVQTVHVAVWDRVTAGQPLLTLDDRELRAQLISQRAQIAVAEAQLTRARLTLGRFQTLTPRGATTEAELEDRSQDAAVVQAQLDAARATVAATEALLARLVVRAPIDATILQVNVRAGEYASPSATTPPLVLGNLDELQLRADVDEQLAPRVRPGRPAVGYLKGDTAHAIPMEFVRIEPFVIPKRSLTGAPTERVDTRVLQVIYKFAARPDRPIYVGQQLDLFIEE